MVNDDQMKTHDDELVFSARYSPFRVWVMVIFIAMFPIWVFLRVSYLNLLRGEYLNAFLFSAPLLLMIYFTLDSILFKELLFYSDRVVKIWHFFGRRTIYYRRAKVIHPPWYLRWLGHAIRETRENGKDLLMQMPVSYVACFLRADSIKMIGKILDYLTEDTENNQKPFRKARLPKEVICL